MEDRKVKGSVLLGYMKFVKNTWGQDGLDELIIDIGMSPDIKESTLYDDDWSTKILAWIAENKGEEYIESAGKYAITYLGDLSHIVGYLDIKSIMKRGSESYSDAFNEGDFIVDLKDTGATIIIRGSGVNDKYACKAWVGVFKGMLEITKTKGTVKEIQCERDGVDHCEFMMEWEITDPVLRSRRLR